MCQRNLKMLSSVQISFFVSMPSSFKRQISRSPEKADLQILSVFVTILVLLLNVTVITDSRVRKFVVMSSLVSLVVSFFKRIDFCNGFVIIILEQYSGIPKHFSGCYFLFQMPALAFCDK